MTHRTITYDELAALVQRLAPSRADDCRDAWVKVGMAIHDADSSDTGYALFEDFSRQSPKFDAKNCRATWKSFKSGGGISVGSLIRWADEDSPHIATPTKRAFTSFVDYATAHGATVDVFLAAGWQEVPHWCYQLQTLRPALAIPTATGTRYRYLDGQKPPYHSPSGYTRCWYRLDEAIVIAERTGQPLVICNGEASTVAAQSHNVAACALAGGTEVSSIPDDLLDELRTKWAGSILVALDCDKQGENAIPLAAQLRSAGYDARALNLGGMPDSGYDLADHCRLHNGTSVAALSSLPELPQSAPPQPTAQPAPRLLHASQLNIITPTTWLIDGVLAMNKLTQLFAPPGSGKSFVDLDKALSVAQHYPVVYVAAEAVEDYQERVAAWCEHHKRDTGQLYFWPEPVSLKDRTQVDAFLTAIHPVAPVAIFFDPLASCMVGLEESSTGDMQIAVDALNRIRKATGSAIEIVHHTGWNDAHERGSSVLRAACRVVMKLSTDDSGLMKLTCEKSNNGKPFEARYFRLVESGPSVVPIPANKVSTFNAPLSMRQIEVLEALDLAHFRDGATHTQIVEHTNLSKSTVNKALDKLISRGLVLTEGKRNKQYRLTDDGRQALLDFDLIAAASSPSSLGGGELGVNWTVNNVEQPIATPSSPSSPNTVNNSEQAVNKHPHEEAFYSVPTPSSPSSPQNNENSPLFTRGGEQVVHSSSLEAPHQDAKFTQVHSEFTSSSLGEFTSSPPVCSLEHGGSELEENEPVDTGVAFARIEPKRVQYSVNRVQELVDAGHSKADAIDIASTEVQSTHTNDTAPEQPQFTLPQHIIDKIRRYIAQEKYEAARQERFKLPEKHRPTALEMIERLIAERTT